MEGIILLPPKNECTYSLSVNKNFGEKLLFSKKKKRQFLLEVSIHLLFSDVKYMCDWAMMKVNR